MVDSSKIGMMPQRPMSASVCSNRSSSGSFGMSFNSRIPMPKSSTVMNSRYDKIIILIFYAHKIQNILDRSSSGSFGMSFNSRIPMPKSSTLIKSRHDEMIILLIFFESQDPNSNRDTL